MNNDTNKTGPSPGEYAYDDDADAATVSGGATRPVPRSDDRLMSAAFACTLLPQPIDFMGAQP